GCNMKRGVTDIGKRLNKTDPDLYQYIEKYWSIGNHKADKFWEHAWVQHGTCMTNLEAQCQGNQGTEDQAVINYFVAARGLHEKYDVAQALADNNIRPGSSAPVDKFRKAIEEAFGAPVVMRCTNSVLDGVQVWFKVRGGNDFEPTEPLINKKCSAKTLTFAYKK
ncbi:ribonuclease T2-like protein, partial [Dimargaris cristalligena]